MDLPPRRVADLCSAVRSLCRVLGKTPGEVPADPGVLGRALRRALPATAGITPARWANIKSLVLKALALTGCRVLPGRSLHPLTPAWAALDALLPTKYFRAALSRLMHYCSAQGIEPDEVDQAVFDRFGDGDPERQLHPQPARRAPDRGPAVEPGGRHDPGLAAGRHRAAALRQALCVAAGDVPGLVPGRCRALAAAGSPARVRSRRGRCGRCGRARSSSGGSICARRPRPWSTAAAIRPPSPASPIWSRSRRCRRSCASSWPAAATGRPRRSTASPPI